jgi:hypothetical protein
LPEKEFSPPRHKDTKKSKIIEQEETEVTKKSNTPIVFSVSSVTSCSKVSSSLPSQCLGVFVVKKCGDSIQKKLTALTR